MKNKALITGATSGIGKATAQKLLANGYDIVLLARRQSRLELLQSEWKIQFPDRTVETIVGDLRDLKEMGRKITEYKPALSEVNILVNNAGLARGTAPAQAARWEDWNEMIQTNFTGLSFLTQKLLPVLEKNKPAHIVNIGSIAGRWAYPGGTIYCATKFAVRAFSEGLRMDLLGKDIRVTNIEPGMVETEFSEVRFDGDKEKAAAVYKGLTPLRAEDIAECIAWSLARPKHVNIQEMVIYPTSQASPFHIYRE